MARYRWISVMNMTSGIAKDATVNTWHVATTAPTLINETTCASAWQTFMRAMAGLFPSTVATSGHTLRCYNLADPEPRAPVYESTWSFSGALSGSSSPPELCIVTSFQGERVSGLLQARRRGRMYIGPLDASVVDVGRFSPTDTGTVATATKALVDAINAITDHRFCVYSRADDAFVEVDNGWVENAVDVQRRRGLAATARSTWLAA
jgi:hypothetical protein